MWDKMHIINSPPITKSIPANKMHIINSPPTTKSIPANKMHIINSPPITKSIPATKVSTFFFWSQCPTKHTISPVNRISRLMRGNMVDLRMDTVI